MAPICRRIQFHEIGDQLWFPSFLHEKLQEYLTLCWTFHLPVLQKEPPAAHICRLLTRTLANSVEDFTYVDFCAGAGGPTPFMEKQFNCDQSGGTGQIKFILSDLRPHISAWETATTGRKALTYVRNTVDATGPPVSLMSGKHQKIFRLYNLSFHHFDDALAASILRSTIDIADGFAIFELQERTIASFLTITAAFIVGFLVTPLYFWKSPNHLFFTYIIPVIPLTFLIDGYISILRTRTPEEIRSLLETCGTSLDAWNIQSSREVHTWPIGSSVSIIGKKSQ